ncbi:MAG: hypothetical protein A3G49_05630 [Candidatus Sungbacteria bacterium RIFCSPLOWO2_12_FULL_41_11]|uniref:Uncharacterized protein n=1 Tax=Candidatus Sungbacteria bacterium RIFCSPLOWO2_12_FULL_41_11 TaxID=1802286 RepID=A0A1G2LSZ6_9BACT|nr:MAG: hypothetical protein UV01_C0008G0029 [Parcubacteria group bacterium GW2011_GWA2_42_14]OGZ99203.1 MAG: hypothetical protein A3D41_02790 [Candidatus Sungbacteria bacterium RIFCSPHIGHO2_02_FULL_41_12b]OHA14634.1 MAG: hypothetical protein A3G49_05630 [Candidatus Sungbacteria bacterium RIFCSPLOWO2_12_FULL_41_11]
MNKKILILIVIIIAVISTGVYFWLQQIPVSLVEILPKPIMPSVPTKNDKTITRGKEEWLEYKRPDFGFSFLYPPFLKASSMGSNFIQQKLDAGEMISGTIPPSFDTILFLDDKNNEWFLVEIFHELRQALTPDVIYQACDTQFNGGQLVNRITNAGDTVFLERKSISPYGASEPEFIFNYFYCFKTLKDDVVVLTVRQLQPLNSNKPADLDRIMLKIMASLKTF